MRKGSKKQTTDETVSNDTTKSVVTVEETKMIPKTNFGMFLVKDYKLALEDPKTFINKIMFPTNHQNITEFSLREDGALQQIFITVKYINE